MAQMKTQEVLSLDFRSGFEWHLVMTLSEEAATGPSVIFTSDGVDGARKVIVEAGPASGRPKLTLALTGDSQLFLAATDLAGTEHQTTLVTTDHLSRLSHIRCVVEPLDGRSTNLLLIVNNVIHGKRTVLADFGDASNASLSLGSDIAGHNPASFVQVEFLGYDKLLSKPGKIHQYLRDKHEIDTAVTITDAHLLEIDRKIRNYRPDVDIISRAYLVSVDILIRFFGLPWVSDNVLRGRTFQDFFSGKPLDDFFIQTGTSSIDSRRHILRVTRLGLLLHHLQSAPGLTEHIEGMRKNKIAAVVSELEAGYLLSLAKVPFVFQPTTDHRNFDLKIPGPSETDFIACEIKSKLNKTKISDLTILKSLKDAARQLPKTRPGLIMMNLPEEWLANDSVERYIENALRAFFRTSSRVGLVIFFWHQPTVGNSISIERTGFRADQNRNSPRRMVVKKHVGDRFLHIAPRSILGEFYTFLQSHSDSTDHVSNP